MVDNQPQERVLGCENNIEFSKAYLNSWCDALNDESFQRAWYNSTDYTLLHMQSVLYPLATKLHYKEVDCKDNKKQCACYETCNRTDEGCYGTNYQQEYYKVDLILCHWYEPSVWTLDYAIEHENAQMHIKGDKVVAKGWFDEFAKLLPLKCSKSRVIIGYDRYDDRSVGTINEKLEKCLALINDQRIASSIANSPILLIIFPGSDYMKKLKLDWDVESNALIKIIEFKKQEKVWTQELISDDVLDENLKKKLSSAYKNILSKY